MLFGYFYFGCGCLHAFSSTQATMHRGRRNWPSANGAPQFLTLVSRQAGDDHVELRSRQRWSQAWDYPHASSISSLSVTIWEIFFFVEELLILCCFRRMYLKYREIQRLTSLPLHGFAFGVGITRLELSAEMVRHLLYTLFYATQPPWISWNNPRRAGSHLIPCFSSSTKLDLLVFSWLDPLF